MTSILSPLNGKAGALDETSRLQLQDNLRGAAENMETPNDTMLRLFNASLEVAVVKVGCDLGLFKALAATKGSLSIDDFSVRHGADPLLLERLFRYLASVRMITETGKGQYAANQTTSTLADPSIEGALNYT